jgi:hypothetical protein
MLDRPGQAADLHLGLGGGLRPTTRLISEIAGAVRSQTGRLMRSDVGADFLLFAWIAFRLAELDVDQLIHEYGAGPGRPGWVHISRREKRTLVLSSYVGEAGLARSSHRLAKTRRKRLSLEDVKARSSSEGE